MSKLTVLSVHQVGWFYGNLLFGCLYFVLFSFTFQFKFAHIRKILRHCCDILLKPKQISETEVEMSALHNKRIQNFFNISLQEPIFQSVSDLYMRNMFINCRTNCNLLDIKRSVATLKFEVKWT